MVFPKEILLAGDPHGDFTNIIRAANTVKPECTFFVGDLCLDGKYSLSQAMAKEWRDGAIWYVPGDHDFESLLRWQNLSSGNLQCWNLHGRIVEIAGMRVAGLGGKFEAKIWDGTNSPTFVNHAAWVIANKHEPWFNEEESLKKQGAIWYEEWEKLAMEGPADILVTHEPPTCHPLGNKAIDVLAEMLEVKLVVHGHMHDALDYSQCGFPYKIIGVGKQGVTKLTGEVVYPGSEDAARMGKRQPMVRSFQPMPSMDS